MTNGNLNMFRVAVAVMYLKSRQELDLLAADYTRRAAMRHSIRMRLHGNISDILLIIYWGQGSFACEHRIHRIARRESGITELNRARDALYEFDGFGDVLVKAAALDVAYLIALVLDELWCDTPAP